MCYRGVYIKNFQISNPHFDVYLYQPNPNYNNLFDFPKDKIIENLHDVNIDDFYFINKKLFYHFPMDFSEADAIVSRKTKSKVKTKMHYDYFPCRHHEDKSIPEVDVVMCTATRARRTQWPHFNELKKLFGDNDIAYVDLNEQRIFNNDCLEYVRKSKCFLTLATGMSHYASKFFGDKTMVIQWGSQYEANLWSSVYNNLEYIMNELTCDYSCLNSKRRCYNQHLHACMSNITPSQVFERIKNKLKK